MHWALILVLILLAIILLILFLSVINRWQFKKMPFEQQVRILMKQARGLVFFKNISYGSKGTLVYIKNKRKILTYPWVLVDGKMLCTKEKPFEKWDYPKEQPPLTEEEKNQALKELEKYNDKSIVKLYIR
ncbi:MAG: hypothetical protein IJ731_09685 [Eubacterium sp.]|nr:hypothetical protein [Eubacterium sp.]